MTVRTESASQTAGRLVGRAAAGYIHDLWRQYREDEPVAVATLAQLRRGAGHPAYAVPQLWGLSLGDKLEQLLQEEAENGRDPEKVRKSLDSDRAEEALHLAVTLWAVHQQSNRERGMHVQGNSLGQAVRRLGWSRGPDQGGEPAETPDPAPAEGPKKQGSSTYEEHQDAAQDQGVRARFVRLATANSLGSLRQRLRAIVLLLRRAEIPLDYGQLAEQLYWWQHPGWRGRVRRAWGRDYHLAVVRKSKTTR